MSEKEIVLVGSFTLPVTETTESFGLVSETTIDIKAFKNSEYTLQVDIDLQSMGDTVHFDKEVPILVVKKILSGKIGPMELMKLVG